MGAARADQHPPASLGQGLMVPGWAGLGLWVHGAGSGVWVGVPAFRDNNLVPKFWRARVMRGKAASEHPILALVQAAVTARLPCPEGYFAVPPHSFFQDQVVIIPLDFHSDPGAPKHFSQH